MALAWLALGLAAISALVALWLFIDARRELHTTTTDLVRRLEEMGDALHGRGRPGPPG